MANQKRKGEILAPPPFHVEQYSIVVDGITVAGNSSKTPIKNKEEGISRPRGNRAD